MKKQIILLFFFFIGKIVMLQAQCNVVTPEQNLNKYWEYRERLKNFVVPGTCLGCSMPSNDRDASTIRYDDALEILGYYIGVLATEYKLLENAIDTGGINQRNRDVAELYYAVNEVYKVDFAANASWRHWYVNNGIGAYSTSSGDLDGFLIRDEVPDYFPNSIVNGDYVENNLDKGLSPMPDGYDVKNVNSNWTRAGTTGDFWIPGCYIDNNQKGGADPLSIDNMSQLYIGLALVSKFIPTSVTYLGQSITQMSNAEEDRIYQLALSNFYTLENTVTHHCGTGTNWANTPPWYLPYPVSDWCKCNESGSAMVGIINLGPDGFISSHYAIQNSFSGVPLYIPAFSTKWLAMYPLVYIGGANEYIMCGLATIGNVWGPLTPTIIGNNALKDANPKHKSTKCDIYPLLYEALWGTKVNSYSSAFYDGLLCSAPCHGVPPGGGHSYNWSAGNRIDGTNGPFGSVGYTSYSSVYSGLDYLLYFNLFEIAYPVINGSGSYVTYQYIHPKDLRESYLEKTNNLGEYDEKNFWATDSIKAGKLHKSDTNYIIANDNDPNQSLFQGRAQVTFKAGHNIDLEPGFEAKNGVFFDAAINTDIHSMYCLDCSDVVNLDSVFLPIDTSLNGTQVNYFSTDTIKNCDCKAYRLFGINGDTAGIKSWYWNFGNGQTSTVYNPSVVYCPAKKIDSLTGHNDTTYLLTVIIQDTAGYDTLAAIIYFRGCNINRAISPTHHYMPASSDTTTFKIFNTLTSRDSRIEYYIPQSVNVKISVYNVMGINMGIIINERENAGRYSLNINTSGYTDGIYFVSIEAGSFVQTKKLIVIRR